MLPYNDSQCSASCWKMLELELCRHHWVRNKPTTSLHKVPQEIYGVTQVEKGCSSGFLSQSVLPIYWPVYSSGYIWENLFFTIITYWKIRKSHDQNYKLKYHKQEKYASTQLRIEHIFVLLYGQICVDNWELQMLYIL